MGRLGARGATVWWLLVTLFVLNESSCRGKSTTIAPSPDGGEPSSGRASKGGGPNTGGSAGVDQPAGRGGTRGGTGTTAGRGGDAGSTDGGRAGDPGGGSAGHGDAGDAGAGYGGDGGAAGSGAGGTVTPGVCDVVRAFSSNLELCSGAFVHRPTAGACDLPVRDGELTLPSNAGEEDLRACEIRHQDGCVLESECTRDADCESDGYCVRDEYDNYDWTHRIRHDCIVPCRTDADCPSDRLCACDFAQQNASRNTISLGRCIPATCRTDGDCGTEALCISPRNPIPDWHTGTTLDPFHCQTRRDQCHGASLCPNDSDSECCPQPACDYSGERFVCGSQDTCDPC